jgi:hypothetical protein
MPAKIFIPIIAVIAVPITISVSSILRLNALEDDLRQHLAPGMALAEVEDTLRSREVRFINLWGAGREIKAYPADGFPLLPYYMRVNIFLNEGHEVTTVDFIHSMAS